MEKKLLSFLSITTLLTACSGTQYLKTVQNLDINRFMGDWYVIASRATFLEKGAHNGVESYTWNDKEKRIDINFTYKKDSFDGEVKSIPQKAWIYNKETNAHWKVQPFWPLKLDYLVIDLDENYEWVVVGVPNQNYVWIMARDWKIDEQTYNEIIDRLNKLSYRTDEIKRVPQKW